MKKLFITLFSIVCMTLVSHAVELKLPLGDNHWSDYSWQMTGDDFLAEIEGYTFLLEKGNATVALTEPKDAKLMLPKGSRLTITAPGGVIMSQVQMLASASTYKVVSQNGDWVDNTSSNLFKFTSSSGQKSITVLSNSSTVTFSQIRVTYTIEKPIEPFAVELSAKEIPEMKSGESYNFTDLVSTNHIDANSLLVFTLDSGQPTDVVSIDNIAKTLQCLNPGTVRINATITPLDNYLAPQNPLSFTLTVIDAPIMDEVTTAKFNLTTSFSLKSFTSDNATYHVKAMKSGNSMNIQNVSSTSTNYKGTGLGSTSVRDNILIDHIVVTLSDQTKLGNVVVQMGNEPNIFSTSGTGAVTAAADNTVITGDNGVYTPEGDYKYFIITAKAVVNITQVDVYYRKQNQIKDAKITVAEAETVDVASGPVQVDNPFSISGEGLEMTYESDNETVATVSGAGIITALTQGTAVITATFPGNSNYNPASATYILTVVNSNILSVDLNTTTLVDNVLLGTKKTYTDERGIYYISDFGLNNGMEYRNSLTYQDGVIVRANPHKYKVESIEFTFSDRSKTGDCVNVYALDKPYTSIEQTSGEKIAENLTKGPDNKALVSFAGKSYSYFSILSPEACSLTNIRVNWIKTKNSSPEEPEVEFVDNMSERYIRIDVDHGYHFYYMMQAVHYMTGEPLQGSPNADDTWHKVEGDTYTITDENIIDYYNPYVLLLYVRTVDPENTSNSLESCFLINDEGLHTGVSGITADQDDHAPIEYYNLQGIRVDNPHAGLYIRRQGRTAKKVLIK